MSETITIEKYQMFLELAPTHVLRETWSYMVKTSERLSENTPEFEALAVMLSMLLYELQIRQIEPLWRKAKRFTIRNRGAIKEAGKIAACVAAGVLLGVSIDDK